MQVIHRLSVNTSPEVRRELAALGIVVGTGGILTTFEVNEAHESWPKIQRWMAAHKPLDIVSTKFTQEEIAAASWLELDPSWHWGYPQPNEDEFGYLEATYDLSDYCEVCGIGLVQKAPFQMKGEPRWGRNGILQLNWVFDEYFVRPEVWAAVFKPRGIACREVLSLRGAQLKTVVQLDIQELVSIATNGLKGEACSTCGRVKYEPVRRGYFPALTQEPKGRAAKTREYFGSGASGRRRVLISRDVWRDVVATKTRGATVTPLA